MKEITEASASVRLLLATAVAVNIFFSLTKALTQSVRVSKIVKCVYDRKGAKSRSKSSNVT